MADGTQGLRTVPVARTELATQDMEMIADLARKLHVEHVARFRCDDPAKVDSDIRSVTAGELSAGLLRYGGFVYYYYAALDPFPAPTAVTIRHGSGVLISAREELRLAPGEVHLVPTDLASAAEPVTLADIAAASGVTARALRHAFRSRYAITPMAYLRQIRLGRAHRELLAVDPAAGVTVGAVARAWGWTSPGRFTAAYQRRFGQLPSRTLRT